MFWLSDGGLIQVAVGFAGGSGSFRTKRSGLAYPVVTHSH
jgi:hypothetical protein